MSILDGIEVSSTYMRRSVSEKPLVTLASEATGNKRDLEFQEEYFLKATIGVTFWANKAQYGDAVKRAEKLLLTQIHKGALSKLAEIRMYAQEQDWVSVCAACDDLQKELGF